MKTKICDLFGIDFPLFAFSHCRDVVAAVTNAGGVGVLGAAAFSAEQLDLELAWIDEQVGGRPYGIDIVMAAKHVGQGEVDPLNFRNEFLGMIPEEHKAFVKAILEEHNVPEWENQVVVQDASGLSHEGAERQLEVALGHSGRLLINALGPMPPHVVERAHTAGMTTAALVGRVDHAAKQVANGVDIIVAQGTEAGGHTGDVSTMVLVPEVVDAVGPDVPVLAAGGIGTGRQIAAALALGAEGVWTGSIWLTTTESSIAEVLRSNLLAAKSSDTVRSRAMTGKPARQLRNAWTEAWDSGTGPEPLPMPLQTLLYVPAKERIEHFGVAALAGEAVGQIVGRMNSVESARDLVLRLATETADVAERVESILNS